MGEATDALTTARRAYARRDWPAARAAYEAAATAGDLAPDDLYALAQCHWWLGGMDACLRGQEAAHRRYLEEGKVGAAAMVALELGVDHLLRGDEPVGSGWLGRAARLAEGVDEGPVHGYLAYILDVEGHVGDPDPSGVIAAARRVQDLGHRHGDATLVALGLNGEGRRRIRAGEVVAGLALLDEAMVAVLAGEVADAWAGNLYCNTIAACHELGDFRRMARWTDATERWLDTLPAAVLFGGICRVHRAQLATLSGDWARAEREAVRVCEDLEGLSTLNAAEAWYEVGEVRRRRGELRAAEEAYDAAHARGRDPQPGLALLRLAQGRTAAALSAISSAATAAAGDWLTQAGLLAAQVEIALAADRTVLAREAADTLAGIAARCGSPGLEAMRATAGGAVLLAEGDPQRALPLLRSACQAWRELDAPYEAARTCVLRARAYRALGDDEATSRECDTAAAEFRRLGAALDADAVALLSDTGGNPGGLSDREVEVLRLVADGRTNREIAEALFISRKTVARHLSNIFTKLGVASRTEAARYAFEHDLVGR